MPRNQGALIALSRIGTAADVGLLVDAVRWDGGGSIASLLDDARRRSSAAADVWERPNRRYGPDEPRLWREWWARNGATLQMVVPVPAFPCRD